MTGNELTPREVEVLRLLAQGLRNREIIDELSISLNTLETHIRHIYAKIEVRDRVEAVVWYIKEQAKKEKK